MWFDTILWLVAIVAFIMVEARHNGACLGLVCGGRCRGHAGQLF